MDRIESSSISSARLTPTSLTQSPRLGALQVSTGDERQWLVGHVNQTFLHHECKFATSDSGAISQLLRNLFSEGHVRISESDSNRSLAVGGVQLLMELSLLDIETSAEFIITPDRATPFRTCNEKDRPQLQNIRKDALLENLQRGVPLHLIFCEDGQGTLEQDSYYQRTIFDSYGANYVSNRCLFEHRLQVKRSEFPQEHSGAIILMKIKNSTYAFAIRAAQVDKIDKAKYIELFFGEVDTMESVVNAVNRRRPEGPSINSVYGEWKKYLSDQFKEDFDFLTIVNRKNFILNRL